MTIGKLLKLLNTYPEDADIELLHKDIVFPINLVELVGDKVRIGYKKEIAVSSADIILTMPYAMRQPLWDYLAVPDRTRWLKHNIPNLSLKDCSSEAKKEFDQLDINIKVVLGV